MKENEYVIYYKMYSTEKTLSSGFRRKVGVTDHIVAIHAKSAGDAINTFNEGISELKDELTSGNYPVEAVNITDIKLIGEVSK